MCLHIHKQTNKMHASTALYDLHEYVNDIHYPCYHDHCKQLEWLEWEPFHESGWIVGIMFASMVTGMELLGVVITVVTLIVIAARHGGLPCRMAVPQDGAGIVDDIEMLEMAMDGDDDDRADFKMLQEEENPDEH